MHLHLGTLLTCRHSGPGKCCAIGRHGDGVTGGMGDVVRSGPISMKLVLRLRLSYAVRLVRLVRLLTFYECRECNEQTRSTRF